MQKHILKLAAYLLDEYAKDLQNNCCNDTSEEIVEMIKEMGIDTFQSMANEWNNGECEDADKYDWIVVHVISNELEKMSKNK